MQSMKRPTIVIQQFIIISAAAVYNSIDFKRYDLVRPALAPIGSQLASLCHIFIY